MASVKHKESDIKGRYIIINYLFLILLSGLCVISLIFSQYIALTLIPLVFIVVYRKTKYYQWFTFFGGVIVISILTALIMRELSVKDDILILVSFFAVSVIFILFGLIMPDRLKPGPEAGEINGSAENAGTEDR